MPKTSAKLDLFAQYASEYVSPAAPVLISTRPARYLSVRGRGAPGSELFQSRIGALYAIAYTLRFTSKFQGRDYAVGKLEGLYGVDGQQPAELERLPKAEWNWRLMIRVPTFVTTAKLAKARRTLREKEKPGDFDAVTLETLREGRSVQMLHVGPYDEEARTIREMVSFAASRGLAPHMWHHEIYLSDPRRVAPVKLRTILRQPVRPHRHQ
jgi:hypothetical protein